VPTLTVKTIMRLLLPLCVLQRVLSSPPADICRCPFVFRAQALRSSYPAAASALDGSPRVDGKEFFRQARARLEYEQFSAFLQV
jgi:hypothetical protein